MEGICRLNNMNMRNIRRSDAYQCVVVDLAMLGVISKEECEMLIGGSVPRTITLPNGKQGHLISEADLPKQPVKIDEEIDQETDQETTDGENN